MYTLTKREEGQLLGEVTISIAPTFQKKALDPYTPWKSHYLKIPPRTLFCPGPTKV